ncbi:MAG: hypothetical protein P8175_06515 [Deltaproteobacteria bacterium]|jgi:hypothetical protein
MELTKGKGEKVGSASKFALIFAHLAMVAGAFIGMVWEFRGKVSRPVKTTVRKRVPARLEETTT